MSQPAPRRRFAPIPIETTRKEVRRGPAPELTPEPSPTSDTAPSLPAVETTNTSRDASMSDAPKAEEKGKRRFAPQLIESTRRSRKAGDQGPATKPADKTDITPYTRHIYSVASRKKEKQVKWPGFARRESCDDSTSDRTFELNSRDAHLNPVEEAALSAFPNAGRRLGGAEHYYVREGSDDDDSGTTRRQGPHGRRASQLDSGEEEEVNWAFKEAQTHAAAKHKDEEDVMSSSPVSSRSEAPPDNTFALTSGARPSTRGSFGLSPIGEDAYASGQIPLRRDRSGSPTAGYLSPFHVSPSSHRLEHKAAVNMYKSHHRDSTESRGSPNFPSREAESGRHMRGAFGRFYGYQQVDKAAEKELFRLRTRASPPMAGKDLTFRMSKSPQQTKLETNEPSLHHLQLQRQQTAGAEQPKGLWGGFCYTADRGEYLQPSPRPAMIMTPMAPATPMEASDPFLQTSGTLSPFMSMEPAYDSPGNSLSTSEHRSRGGQPKGVHMLAGLDQRLAKEKAAADLEERISTEFTDVFVTQVYNYLSLGYPAMARAYDEELSKISRISRDDLQQDDARMMSSISSDNNATNTKSSLHPNGKPKGHATKMSMDLDEEMSEDLRSPRWRALKKYIYEWASQHPDLDSISPLAWGVQERRGSWGL